jgi:hypothetical protein
VYHGISECGHRRFCHALLLESWQLSNGGLVVARRASCGGSAGRRDQFAGARRFLAGIQRPFFGPLVAGDSGREALLAFFARRAQATDDPVLGSPGAAQVKVAAVFRTGFTPELGTFADVAS